MSNEEQTHAHAPLATVVVCTFNRAAMLARALESLSALTAPHGGAFEILVVDNGSTDDTPQTIAEATRRWPHLVRGVQEVRPGVAAARNRGVREARGEWIAFFDDDQRAEPDWLIELLAVAVRRDVLCTGGRVLLDQPDHVRTGLRPFCRVLAGETVGRDVEFAYGRKEAPGAGNLLIHRSVFAKIGLFDETLTSAGEDTDLFRRIRAAGFAAWYTPRALVWHCLPADRLEEAALCWTAARIGGHVARRERLDYGWAGLVAVCGLRLALWGCKLGLRRLRAAATRDAALTLENRCLEAFASGYLRRAAAFLLPGACSDERLFSGLCFRARGATPSVISRSGA